MKEDEQSIVSGSDLEGEVRWLCDSEDRLNVEIDSYPKGSCNWNISKIYLRQVRTRLEELGVDSIEEEKPRDLELEETW